MHRRFHLGLTLLRKLYQHPSGSFNEQLDLFLKDYIEMSLMLQYNGR